LFYQALLGLKPSRCGGASRGDTRSSARLFGL